MEEISSFIVPGSVAAVIIALSIFIIRAVKTNSDVNSDTVAALRLEIKTVRAERDYERNEKHSWQGRYTAEMYLRDAEHHEFKKFLETKGIDPGEFTFREKIISRGEDIPSRRETDI